MIALNFHTEELHDDRVWRRLYGLAHWMARKGVQVTFFVYPFRAQVAHRDISERVQTLAELGHEIGQHTHFYAGVKIGKPGKENDLSDTNMVYCLQRDFKTLCEMGIQPEGFTTGAWVINETVLKTLVELGFAYDCSARFPKGKRVTPLPNHRWLRSMEIYQGTLLCLPTTCSLGEWFKGGYKVTICEEIPHHLVYLHDYDLLRTPIYFLVWLFGLLNRKELVPVGRLSEQVRDHKS